MLTSRVRFFYDWYIEQRYFIDTFIDTLLILGICQCGATILGDLPTFQIEGGGIQEYQFINLFSEQQKQSPFYRATLC